MSTYNCPECLGSGEIISYQYWDGGIDTETCVECGGEGQIANEDEDFEVM